MAHNISRVNGRDEMFYYGETPWHGLGTKVEHVATSEEALVAAHLDWTVEKRAIFLDNNMPIPGSKAVVRQDTGNVLGIVGSGFKPIQNREAFAILDDLVGEGGARFHTAGALKSGEKVWALIEMPETTVVVGDDVVKHYLLMANGHNGSLAYTLRPTDIRVVCNNTMDAALGLTVYGRQKRVDGAIYIRHSESADVRLSEVRRILGIAEKTFQVAGESYKAMTTVQVNEMMLKGYLNAVFPIVLPVNATDDQKAAASAKQKQLHETVAFLFHEGRGNQLPGVKDTLWAAFNAVTEYVDHVHVTTKAGELKKNGLEAALFGVGAETRKRAYSEAVAILNG